MPAQEPEVRRSQARDQRRPLEHHAERGSEPEQDELGLVGLDVGEVAPPCPAHRPNQISTSMQTRLLTMGAQATATKRRRVFKSAVPSA